MNLLPSRFLPFLATPLLLLAGRSFGEDKQLDSGDFSRFPLAQSEVDTGIRIGATVDNDQRSSSGPGGLVGGILDLVFPPDANATGDDQTGSDDEDGVTAPPLVAQGATVTIPVIVFNNSGTAAYLNAWMDFNNDGAISNVLYTTAGGEKLMNQITLASSATPTTQNITFVVPVNASLGTGRGMRWRVTTLSNPGYDGEDGKGEVEDYVVDITTPGFCYGIAAGSLYEINITTGAGTRVAGMVFPGTGNATAYTRDLGADGVVIYGTGMLGDVRLGVWDRTTGANNEAGNLADFGVPSSGLIRCGGWYAGRFWFINNDTDDLWKVSLTGSSGNYVITGATKVADIWLNTRGHFFGDFIVKPDGTMLAHALRTGGNYPEFFTANLNSPAPVATLLGSPTEMQNGIALGLNGKIYSGLGPSSGNRDWYILSSANGSITSTVGASNLIDVADMTIAAPYSAPIVTRLIDFGDLSRFAPASNMVLNNLRLGGMVDGELTATTNTTATGDDTTGADDEDGAAIPTEIIRGSSVTIPVTVFNNTGSSAYLSAWIDFNNDGVINDVVCTTPGGEKLVNQITVPTNAAATTQNITFLVPSGAVEGTARGVRLRLNSIGGQGPLGSTGHGEVEDYLLNITSSSLVLEPYCGSQVFSMGAIVTGTTFSMASTNAGIAGQTGIASGVTLNFTGGGITGPFLVHPPQSGSLGGADDLPGTGGAPLVATLQDLSAMKAQALGLSNAAASLPPTQTFPAKTASFTVNATAPDGRNVILIDEVDLTAGGVLTINGGPLDTFVINIARKMSFTGNSDMALTGGIDASNIMFNLLPGSTSLDLTGNSASYSGLFVAVQPGNRVTATGGGVVTGGVFANELSLSGGAQIFTTPYKFCTMTDYSDHSRLPLTASRARPLLRLGATIDAETAAQPNATATGDDTTGVDDEDGATLPAFMLTGDSVTIPVRVFNNTGASAYLNAWLDLNNDGTLNDALVTAGGDKLTNQITVPSGAAEVTDNVTFTIPSATIPAAGLGLRIRLTSTSNPGPSTISGYGEVEDYAVRIDTVKLLAGMEVRPAGTGTWSASAAAQAGTSVEYRLTLTNSGSLPLRDPVVVDLLPGTGDTGAVDTAARLSAWRGILTGPVVVPTGINALYSLAQNPQRPEVLSPNPAGSVPPAWSELPANPGTVRSLKLDGTGLTLVPGASLSITWTLSAPWDATPLSTAWNSAGAIAVRADTGTPIAAFETTRSGFQALPATGQFYGDRVWADSNSDGRQTPSEPGVNGVRVDFYRDNGDGIADPLSDTPIATTFTDTISGQAGSYRFGNFAPGNYFAAISPSDTWAGTLADQGTNDAADSDADDVIRNGRRVEVMPVTQIDAGESDLTWDAGLEDRSAIPAVWAIAETANGRMLLAGKFTKSHGVARNNIVRVDSAVGEVDTSFDPGTGFNDTVRSLAIRGDGMILAGGNFTSYNGSASRGIALLSTTGAWDSRPAQPNTSEVNWVGTSGNSMYLAGRFTKVGGVPCGNVARLKADGTVDATFNRGSGANETIHSGAVLPDGSIVLAGAFSSFHGTPRKGVVRLKADGDIDAAFNPGTGAFGEVYSVKPIEDGRVILTGNFTSFNGTPCNGAIRLSVNGTVDPSMKKSGLNVDSISTSN